MASATATGQPTSEQVTDALMSVLTQQQQQQQQQSASPVATTSAVTLDQASAHDSSVADASHAHIHQSVTDLPIKEEDEEAITSLVNGMEQDSKEQPTFSTDSDKHNGPIAISSMREIQEGPQGPIQAYAKLEFPGFSYYIQTLDFTIGRRPAHFRERITNAQHITGSSKAEGDVDVDLGPLKSISRFHVRVFYQDQPSPSWSPDNMNPLYSGRQDMIVNHSSRATSTEDERTSRDQTSERHDAPGHQGRFVLQVLGRNGACVDDVYVGKDAVVPLGRRTKIQIAERVFYFVLPPPVSTLDDTAPSEYNGSLVGSSVEDDDLDDPSEASSLGSDSDEQSSEEEHPFKKPRPKLVVKQSPSKVANKVKSKGQKPSRGEADDESDDDAGNQSSDVQEMLLAAGRDASKWAATASIANRKRKRGEPLDEEEEKALKVGTPIGVEALNLNKKKKKKGEQQDSSTVSSVPGEMSSSSSPSKSGRGKGAGKAAIVSAALAAKAKADEEGTKAHTSLVSSATSKSAAAHTLPANAPVDPTSLLSHSQTNMLNITPHLQANSVSTTSLGLSTTTDQVSTEGTCVKPTLSNDELIQEALQSPLAASRGNKLTLQEVYDYLTNKYEWFRYNSRANGHDWHNSIRQTIGSSKDMVRIPRKANELGKGIFYALASSEAARLYKAEHGSTLDTSSPIASPTPPPSGSVQSTPRPPAVAPNGRVTIVIGKAPQEALTHMAAAPKAAITQSIEALFGGPPIVHHEGVLFLSPLVFGKMSQAEINDIGGKGAQQALAILQSHLVTHLQSKMNVGRGSPQVAARPSPSPTPRPLQQAPSRPPRPSVPAPSAQSAPSSMSPQPSSSVRPVASSRPVGLVNRPLGSTAPTSTNPTVRPGMPTTTNRPPLGQMSNGARPAGRPPLNTGTRLGQPLATSLPTRPTNPPSSLSSIRPGPGRPPLSRPMGQPPSSTISRPAGMQTNVGTIRPTGQSPGGTVPPRPGSSSNAGVVRPTTNPARPVGRPPLGSRPAIPSQPPQPGQQGTSGRLPLTSNTIGSRPPGASPQPGPVRGAQQSGVQPRPQLSTNSTTVASRPTVSARPPPAGQVPQAARPNRPPIPVRPTGVRPSTQGIQGTLNLPPNASSQPGARPQQQSAAISHDQSSARTAATSSSSSTSLNTSAPPMSADIAELLSLLGGGKMDSGKLTPAQHELLQRAGRLAAEQQKAQQQKAAAAVASVTNPGASSATTRPAAQSSGASATPPSADHGSSATSQS